MLPKRLSRSDSSFTDSERHLILAAETLRAGDAPAVAKEVVRPEERISLFWRVFGGTILSICALTVMTAYQSLANGIHDLRGDLGRLRETCGEYIKKDEFNSRSTTMWNSIREAQSLNAPVTVLTTKVAGLEEQRKLVEQDHKDVLTVAAAVQAVREKDAVLEKQLREAEAERRDLTREVQQLRERLAKLEGQTEGKPKAAAAKADPDH